MTTYNYVAAPTTEDNIEAAKVEIEFLRGEVTTLRTMANDAANKIGTLKQGIQQQLKLLVEDESIDVATCNDITDALGIERIQFVKEYEVTLSGTWYVTVTLEATDVDDAETQCQEIDIDLDVNIPHARGITLHAAELSYDNSEVAEA